MDRPRRRSRLLITLAGLAVGLGAARADLPAPPPLRALRWITPGADAVRVLTRRPAECLALQADPEGAWRVEVGRAAFRNPLLLGGQAARAGVACETCHRSGRTNPDFEFPGLSGAPGTADVTSFVFSTHRGDHVDDPRPIPDLGGPKTALKVSQSPASPALKTFIRGLVVEEFDGTEPPAAVLDGLAAYVRALNPAACGSGGWAPVTVGDALSDVRRAVAAAQGALARQDPSTALVMIQAARARLGDIAERYAGAALARQRHGLEQSSLELGAIEDQMRRAQPGTGERLALWLARGRVLRAALLRLEGRSLYDPGRLAVVLGTDRYRRAGAAGQD